MNDTRSERQKECIHKWIKKNGRGTIVASTGFGKTRIGLMVASALIKRSPEYKIIVIVPTELLQQQWIKQLDSWGLGLNSEVYIINSVVKHSYKCELLILDECHRYNSELFRSVFKQVHYQAVLGLTATFERLDGLEKIAAQYCPVVDKITVEEALINGWVSQYSEYKVILNNVDLTEYEQANIEFQTHFAFFNYNFPLAMQMVGKDGYKARIAYRDFLYTGDDPKEKSDTLKQIMIHSVGLMHTMQTRKKFIYECPDKVRLTREIMKYRSDKKIITFSATTKIAESIGNGYVYTGKTSKKKSRIMIEDFMGYVSGTLHTVKKANEGMDISGLSVAINLYNDSSVIKTIQKKGRVIRKESNKVAEIFTFVVAGTVEEQWYANSHPNSNCITIDEEGLMHVLKHEPYTTYHKPLMNFAFRY